MRTMLIMAGGTGGHIFPGLALADEARHRGWSVHWLGAERQMEETLVPKHGIPLHTLPVAGFRGKGTVSKLSSLWHLAQSVLRALRLMTVLRPDVVVGFGGFASAPGGIAAVMRRIPLVLHEQNAIPGTTNRWLARFARVVTEAFPGSFPGTTNATWVGNPVRQSIAQLPPPERRFADRDGALRLLVIGGSRGAAILNDTLPEAVREVAQPLDIRHQTGSGHLQKVREAYELERMAHRVTCAEFIEDMAEALGWADLVICRAGALTVSELTAAGVGSVLVPYPHAIDDHQTANARTLSSRAAGILMPQSDLSPAALAVLLNEMTRERCLAMARAAHQPMEPPAAARLMHCILDLPEVAS